MSATHVLRGTLTCASNGEEDELLAVRGEDEIVETVAEWASGVLARESRQVSIRYFTADRPVPIEDLVGASVRNVLGVADADYSVMYSETTGYLWTDEEFNVGGHNIIRELGSYMGSFLHLEMDVHERPT